MIGGIRVRKTLLIELARSENHAKRTVCVAANASRMRGAPGVPDWVSVGQYIRPLE